MCKYCEKVLTNSSYCQPMIWTDNCDIGISYDKDNNVFIRLYDDNSEVVHTDSPPIRYCPFCGRDLTISADDYFSNLGEHLKTLSILDKLNYQYVSYRKGYKFKTFSDNIESDSLDIQLRLTNDIRLYIRILINEPITKPLLFSLFSDNEVIITSNATLDIIVEEVPKLIENYNKKS